MAFFRTLTTLLLTIPVVLAAQAQDDLDIEMPEIRRYTVEIIVFRYAQEVSAGSEIFAPDKTLIDDPITDDESLVIDGEPLEEIQLTSRVYRDVEFVLLDEVEYTLGDIMSRLRRLDVYEPLMHFAWTQATWPDEDTLPIDLGAMGALPPGLNGTLRLYLSRYLHLVVDLKLDAPRELQGSGSLPDATLGYRDYRSFDEPGSPNDSTSRRTPYDFGTPPPTRYRIEENRILRSGELRYFDHPKFGVLAKVSRVEEDAEELPDPADSELLGYPAE